MSDTRDTRSTRADLTLRPRRLLLFGRCAFRILRPYCGRPTIPSPEWYNTTRRGVIMYTVRIVHAAFFFANRFEIRILFQNIIIIIITIVAVRTYTLAYYNNTVRR